MFFQKATFIPFKGLSLDCPFMKKKKGDNTVTSFRLLGKINWQLCQSPQFLEVLLVHETQNVWEPLPFKDLFCMLLTTVKWKKAVVRCLGDNIIEFHMIM